MFSGPSSHTQTVDMVMLYIVGISVILLLGITATMIYFVFKYHRKKGHKPVDIHGNVLLEIIWIAIPTFLVLTMFYFGYMGFAEIRNIPDDALVVKTTARMWAWQFDYANGKQSDTLFVPVNKHIKLEMESADVNHSLYIPAFRIKEDVIAGKVNYLGFKAEETGTYDIACAEFCGLKHSMMYTAVVALPQEEFDTWLNASPKDTNNAVITDSTKVE